MIYRLKMAGLWFASDVWRAARTAVFFVQIALVGFTDSKPNFELSPIFTSRVCAVRAAACHGPVGKGIISPCSSANGVY